MVNVDIVDLEPATKWSRHEGTIFDAKYIQK